MSEKKYIIQEILQEKVERFVFDFINHSRKFFCDTDGELIHPGEFGVYREKICMELIRCVVPMRLDFGTGFIVDSKGNVSHQCDIIIYDVKNTPLIENDERQRFFPVETVVGVGEVKSVLTKEKLEKTLCKLSEVKEIRKNIEESRYMLFEANNAKRKYMPDLDPRDQLFTFVICESFSFKTDNLVNEISRMYKDIDPKLRHNMVLSVRDGAFMYCDEEGKALYFPSMGNDILKNCKIGPFESTDMFDYTKYAHIHSFLNYMYQGIANTTILYPELSYYLENGLHSNIQIEEN